MVRTERKTERMIRAIEDYKVAGVETTLSLESMHKYPAFISGNFDTHFVKSF